MSLLLALSLFAGVTFGPPQPVRLTHYDQSHHGGVMANGQVYDHADPHICASNDYELGQVIVVEYRGRYLVCRVEDRMAGWVRQWVDVSGEGARRLELGSGQGFVFEVKR